MRFAKHEGVAGTHQQLARGAFCTAGQQAYGGVRTVYFVVVILHFLQRIRCFHHTCTADGDVSSCLDRNIHKNSKRQVSEGIVSVADIGFVLHAKRCGEVGVLHIKFLLHVGRVVAVYASAIYFEVRVKEVKTFEKIAYPSPTIKVVSPCQNYIFYLKRLRRRHNTNDAVCHRDAVIIGRVNGGGFYFPGVLGGGNKSG